MFTKRDYDSPRMRETEIYYQSERTGASAGKRRKPTKEEIQRANHRHKVKELRRIIQLNFTEEDHLFTFKPPKNCGWTVQDLQKARKRFTRLLRTDYKKHGAELKYIYRQEIGKKGGLHFHMLINEAGVPLSVIKDLWQQAGGWNVNIESLYDEGGYEDLAEYIVKAPPSEIEGQITMDAYQLDKLSRYGCSRNLVRPTPEEHECTHKEVDEMVRFGVKADEGYYLDKDSVYIGQNPYTGLSYIFYRQYKIFTPQDLLKARSRTEARTDDRGLCVDEVRHRKR